MTPLVVGVGDCQVSADPAAMLVTYALGSCIAVAIWDPVARVGGLLHFMLPGAGPAGAGEAAARPCRYADTGTPLLFRAAYRMGARKRRLVVRLAGGAAVAECAGLLNIGRQNHAAVRRILRQAGVAVHAEDVGGTASRTVRMEVGTGKMMVRGPGGAELELAAPGRVGWRNGERRQPMRDSVTAHLMAPDLPEADGRAASGALDVLETMFFETPLGPVRAGAPPAGGAEACMEFAGTLSGRFELRLDAPAAARLTASYFGREDERTVTAPESELALLELANMLCGAALSRMHRHGRFRLGAPRLGRPGGRGTSGAWLIVPLESGRVAFRLACGGGS